MQFKTERIQNEFPQVVKHLQTILIDLDQWSTKCGEEIIITCLIRTPEEQQALLDSGLSKFTPDKDVHCLKRAADVRLFKNHNMNLIVGDYINPKFPYDPNRPHMKTLITHEGTAFHHHIQVMG